MFQSVADFFLTMRKIIPVILLLLLIPLFAWLSYRQQSYYTLDGFAQGTTYRVIYQYPFGWRYMFNRRSAMLQDEIDSLLAGFDRSLSLYVPESVISRVNRNDPGVVADDYFVEIFKTATEVTRKTGGAFDITVGPLVNAWGFGPDGKADPGTVNIDSLLQLVGMDKVVLQGRKLVKKVPGVQLDVNAIAQGYAVDVVGSFLESRGIRNYLIELGGEIRTRGHKINGRPWTVGIDRPVDNNLIPGQDLQVIMECFEINLATSGNYRKFYEKNGVKYAHSIDPRSGYPVLDRLLSVTITAPDCMTADAYATACMVMGLEEGISLVEEMPELEGYFIYSDEKGAFKTWMTEGFRQYLREDQLEPSLQ